MILIILFGGIGVFKFQNKVENKVESEKNILNREIYLH